MEIYSYFRSGTSHRLRIALALKGLNAQYRAVDLLTDQHQGPTFRAINPQGLVPALVLDDGQVLIQSPAIIEWLEERHPQPALLPAGAEDRARVRAMAAIVGCDTHPINNRRILEYLKAQFGASAEDIDRWAGHWISAAFDALEALLAQDSRRGHFCFGGRPGLADVYLVPQVTSARRFKVDLSRWPLIAEVNAACEQLDAFRNAAPLLQPDAPA